MEKKILITPKSFSTYKEKAYKLITEAGYTPVENPYKRTLTEDEMSEMIRDVEGIIVGVDPLNAKVLENARNLKAISKYGSGLDNVDLIKAEQLNIKVSKALGANSVSVAELAVGLMFDMARNIVFSVKSVKCGGWDRKIGTEIEGKTAGVIGGGMIGQEFAKRAAGLGMKVMIYDPYFKNNGFLEKYGIELASFEKTVEEADFITLHLPLTNETRHLFDRNIFKKMKNTAFLINTARGELVNENDLYDALTSGEIAGAAQDVFSSEPPNGDEKLLSLDNFILTSHIGAFTKESVEKMVMISTRNLLEMLSK